MRGDVTVLLGRVQAGEQEAEELLFSAIYDELERRARAIRRRERQNHTIQTTELISEAYIRLKRGAEVDWQGREHFFRVAARVMRHFLIDYARKRMAEKHGGGALVDFDVDLLPTKRALSVTEVLALDQAMERLRELDSRAHQVVEFRFYGGRSVEETAKLLDIGPRTVKRDWKYARACLLSELAGGTDDGP